MNGLQPDTNLDFIIGRTLIALLRYDPHEHIVPDAWLELDESERMHPVARYHRRQRIRLPNETIHAVMHVIVENQVALGDSFPAISVDEWRARPSRSYPCDWFCVVGKALCGDEWRGRTAYDVNQGSSAMTMSSGASLERVRRNVRMVCRVSWRLRLASDSGVRVTSQIKQTGAVRSTCIPMRSSVLETR